MLLKIANGANVLERGCGGASERVSAVAYGAKVRLFDASALTSPPQVGNGGQGKALPPTFAKRPVLRDHWTGQPCIIWPVRAPRRWAMTMCHAEVESGELIKETRAYLMDMMRQLADLARGINEPDIAEKLIAILAVHSDHVDPNVRGIDPSDRT